MPWTAWRDRLFPSPDIGSLTIWALDLEMSGLDPGRDQIVAVGMVPVRAGVIYYGERYVSLVRPADHDGLSSEGIGIHHLLPGDLAGAPPLADVVPEVERRLAEGPLLVHFANLDVAFLKAAFRAQRRPWPAPVVIDTVDLILEQHRMLERWTPHPAPPKTGLAEARAAVGLPAYPGHDALSDALATAELFLALTHRLGARKLRDLR